MTTCASTPNTAPEAALVHVAVGVLEDGQGRVLVSRRPEHVHQGGLWEFPGGKLEVGESVTAALDRELAEELGVRVEAARPLIRVRHDYADKSVLLDVWRVTRYRGRPQGLEGQPLDWRLPDELIGHDFPAADRPILNALRLPDTYLITGEPTRGSSQFLARLETALERGARLVQLRAKSLAPAELAGLYPQARDRCRRHGARLLLNGPPELARALNVDGLHLDSRALERLERRPIPGDRWLAASCHNAPELARAHALGVDFAVVSPVLPTASHPGAIPLGWSGLQALIASVPFPVYALGGMTPDHLPTAWAVGARGIAAIRGIWGEP